MLLTDLVELKQVLEISPSNTEEDAKLWFLIEQASAWIEELLGRDIGYKSRTQYYGGTNTRSLILRNRPVVTSPTIQVWQDNQGYWGQTADPFPSNTQLTYGTDFVLAIDNNDGVTSRSGILLRINSLWYKARVRDTALLTPYIGANPGSIKVVYTAGWTCDTLPRPFRLAMNILVARLRQLLPLGFLLTSESYQDRAVSYFLPHKRKLLDEVWSMVSTWKNWSF